MTGYSKKWEAWRRAEEAIDKVGVDEAAATLPPRLGWLLRATHALWIGDHGASATLQVDGDAPPFAGMLLSDAILEAGAVEPTKLRALFKRHGAKNKPFPFLDLVRLMGVAVSGERSASAAPALKKYAREGHTVLDAATMGLHSSFTAYQLDDDLIYRSPRFASAWAASLARHTEDVPVRGLMARYSPKAKALDEGDWPDLDEYVVQYRGQPVSGATARDLEAFLAAPLEQAWHDGFHEHLAPGRKPNPDAAHRILGKLIDAVHQLILADRWSAAQPVIEGAIDMTRTLGYDGIRHWLSDAWTRNEVLNGPRDPVVLDAVWASSADMPAGERDQVALYLVRMDDKHELSWKGGDEAKVGALRVGYAADRSDYHLARMVLSLRPKLQRKAIAEVPKHRRPLVESGVQALKGNYAAAVTLAGGALLGETDVPVDREMALIALNGANGEASAARSLPKQVLRDLVDRNRIILETALEKGVPLSATNLYGMLVLVDAVTDEATTALLRAAGGHMEAAQSAGFDGEIFTVTPRLQIVLSLSGHDAAQEQFKRYGRWLRTLPTARATRSALCTACSFCRLLSTMPPGDDNASPRREMLAWRQSLTAYVEQQGDTQTAKAAAFLVSMDHQSTQAVEQWLSECSSFTGTTEAWSDFIAQLSPWSMDDIQWQSADDLGSRS